MSTGDSPDDFEDAVFEAASSEPPRKPKEAPPSRDPAQSTIIATALPAATPPAPATAQPEPPAQPVRPAPAPTTLSSRPPAAPDAAAEAPSVFTTDDAPVRQEAALPVESIFHEEPSAPDVYTVTESTDPNAAPISTDAYIRQALVIDDPSAVAAARSLDRPEPGEVPPTGGETQPAESARHAPAPLHGDEEPLPLPPAWWSWSMVGWAAVASAAVVLGTVGGLWAYNRTGIAPSAPQASPLDVEIREAERLAEEATQAQFGETVSLDEAITQARKARDVAMEKKASPFDVGRAETIVDKLIRLRLERSFKAAIEAIWFDEAAGEDFRIEPGEHSPTPNSVRYQAAFRDFGVDRDLHDSRKAAEQLLPLPKARRDEAIAALDDWSTQADFWTRNWIGEVIARLDQDHERMGVRLAVGRGDRHAVARASRDGAILRQPTPQLFFVARTLMSWNQADDAVALLQRAQASRPNDFWVQHLLGSAALMKRSPDSSMAAAAFTAAEALHPNAYTETQLGIAWSNLGRHDEALICWRRAVERAPKYRNVRLLLAEADDSTHDAEDVVLTYQNLRRDYPLDPSVPLAEARFLVKRDFLREAIAPYEEAAHQGSTQAPAELARVYARLHRHYEAAMAYEWAMELTPDEPDLHAQAANEYAALNRLDEAFDHAKKCVAAAPGDVNGYLALTSLYRRKHRADDAIAAARRALEFDPRRADAWDALGLALTETGDSNGAIDAFQHAVSVDPHLALAQSHLGSELALAGRTSEAIAPMQRAVRLDPNDHVTRRNLAVLLEGEGRWGEAVDAWEEMLRVEPLNAEVRCNLAFSLHQDGRFVDAAAQYTQAFAESPSLADDVTTLRRYDAARNAVAAANHNGFPPDASVARVMPNAADLRQQSLAWLNADLVGWRERLAEEDAPETRFAAANVLGHWLSEPSLASIRDSDKIAALPEDERREWEQLWSNVRRMRREALPQTAVSATTPSRATVAKPTLP